MNQQSAKVIWNKRVGPSCHRLGLLTDTGYSGATPGQFVTLKMDHGHDPLLRRPFSIHRLIPGVTGGDKTDGQGIEVLFKVVGRSTMTLSELREGETVNVLGPLGQGFTIPETHKDILLVAGGIGVAPLVFLAEFMVKKGVDPSCCRAFVGGATKDDLLCTDDFSSLGMETNVTTDDGSAGRKGLVTDLVKDVVTGKKPDMMYACGPHPMLKSVAGLANENGINCQLSLETVMVCGVGACLGCAINVEDKSGKYGHICADGPVFDSRSVFF